MTELSCLIHTRFAVAGLIAALLCTPLAAQVSVGWQTEPLTGPYGKTQTTDMDVTDSGVCYVCGIVPTSSGDLAPGPTLMRIEANGSVAWSYRFQLFATTPFVAALPNDGGALQVESYLNFTVSQYRVFAVKFDAAGNVAWNIDVPGLTANTVNRPATRYMRVDALGNAYVGGSSPTGSTSVPRVVSLDSAGGVRFSTPLTLTLGAFTTAATVDVLTLDPITNDILVAGHSGFSVDAGTTSYVARLTSTGAVLWVRETPAPAGLYVWVIDIGIDGQGRVTTLEQQSTNDYYPGTVSYALIRRDATGAPAGSIPFTSTISIPQLLEVGRDGTVIVSGLQTTFGYPTYCTRYDETLSLVWERSTGVINDAVVAVTLGANGDITLSGTRYVPGFPHGHTDLLCIRLDAAGNLDWQFQLGPSPANEMLAAHDVDDAGIVRLSVNQEPGFTSSSFNMRQFTLELDPEVHSFCHGDASSGACPCGNASGVLEQAGCLNSTGNAAQLATSGGASLANDTLALACSNVDTNTVGLLVEGSGSIAPLPFGDGLFCSGGSLLRLYIRTANGGILTFPGAGDPAIHVRSAALGGAISAGQRRTYQTWYRDASLAFCPTGGAFNFSNGLLVLWAP